MAKSKKLQLVENKRDSKIVTQLLILSVFEVKLAPRTEIPRWRTIVT